MCNRGVVRIFDKTHLFYNSELYLAVTCYATEREDLCGPMMKKHGITFAKGFKGENGRVLNDPVIDCGTLQGVRDRI